MVCLVTYTNTFFGLQLLPVSNHRYPVVAEGHREYGVKLLVL